MSDNLSREVISAARTLVLIARRDGVDPVKAINYIEAYEAVVELANRADAGDQADPSDDPTVNVNVEDAMDVDDSVDMNDAVDEVPAAEAGDEASAPDVGDEVPAPDAAVAPGAVAPLAQPHAADISDHPGPPAALPGPAPTNASQLVLLGDNKYIHHSLQPNIKIPELWQINAKDWTALTLALAQLPARRQVEKPGPRFLGSRDRDYNMVAAIGQSVGLEAPEPCNMCRKGRVVFSGGCIVWPEGVTGGKQTSCCFNCRYHWQYGRCSLYIKAPAEIKED
ncbi:hypothetical protein F5Y09DRAFT_351136 [Xylaria sp. FL1042]|nr:hypothetical protein F5Y09DRAFT_351136 [Xylaria sp. FL1042]